MSSQSLTSSKRRKKEREKRKEKKRKKREKREQVNEENQTSSQENGVYLVCSTDLFFLFSKAPIQYCLDTKSCRETICVENDRILVKRTYISL